MKPTITCPTCGLEHGLFWRVSSDTDRQLSYRCNKVQHQVQTSANFNQPEFHSFTAIRPVTNKDVLASADQLKLPSEYTAAYRKQLQNKQQQQFVLMYKEKP